MNQEHTNPHHDSGAYVAALRQIDRSSLPADGGDRFNRLIFARSPYLLQHAENPVAWYEWGEAAFEAARSNSLPVLVSIGYATCHWCHVMARESFEDREVADLLAGSSITLTQIPDSNSTLATWSGDCSGTGSCSINNIAANRNVTATFPYSSMAKVNSTSTGFEGLGLAYGGSAATDTIFARAVTFPTADWLMNAAKTITLKGGRDAYYADLSGQYSILSGKLSINNGKLIAEKLKIK